MRKHTEEIRSQKSGVRRQKAPRLVEGEFPLRDRKRASAAEIKLFGLVGCALMALEGTRFSLADLKRHDRKEDLVAVRHQAIKYALACSYHPDFIAEYFGRVRGTIDSVAAGHSKALINREGSDSPAPQTSPCHQTPSLRRAA